MVKKRRNTVRLNGEGRVWTFNIYDKRLWDPRESMEEKESPLFLLPLATWINNTKNIEASKVKISTRHQISQTNIPFCLVFRADHETILRFHRRGLCREKSKQPLRISKINVIPQFLTKAPLTRVVGPWIIADFPDGISTERYFKIPHFGSESGPLHFLFYFYLSNPIFYFYYFFN